MTGVDPLSACGCALTLSLGIAYQEAPPGGTWWEPPQPAHFSHVSPMTGAGLRGSNWSFEFADLGWQHSSAVACAKDEPACTSGATPMSHWLGRQNPRGAWASWEPHLAGSLQARIGLGVVDPHFTMNIPDFIWSTSASPTVLTVNSNRWSPSWVAGFIVKTKRADVIIDYRSVAPLFANDTPGNFHALSRAAYTLSLRFAL